MVVVVAGGGGGGGGGSIHMLLSFVAQRDERKRTKQSMDPRHMRVL